MVTDPAACPARTRIFEAGPEYTGQAYAKYKDEACSPNAPSSLRARSEGPEA